MKKICCIILSLLVCLSLSACSKKKEKEKVTVAFITDTLGMENKDAKEFVEGIEKGFENYELNLKIVTPENSDEYEKICNNEVMNLENDFVVSNTYTINTQLMMSTNSVLKDSQLDPKVAVVGNLDETDSTLSIAFKEEEAGFIAGVLAAKTSKSGVIGYVGGYSNQYTEYQIGYEAGAKTVNKKIKVITVTTGSYNSVSKGYEKTIELIDNNNADVIFTVCGGSEVGVNEACEERNVKIITSDMYTESNEEITLARIDKNYGNAAIYAVEQYLMESKFPRKNYRCGYMEDVINLVINEDLTEQAALDEVKKYEDDFIEYAPLLAKNKTELEKFKYANALEEGKKLNDPDYQEEVPEEEKKETKGKDNNKKTDNKKK